VPPPAWVARAERDVLNPAMRRMAGHGPYADLEHVGRRTGVVRRTPLRGFVHGDDLYLGLNHGNQPDWCRNVGAAGRCRVKVRGRWYTCADPRVVPFAAVRDRFPQPERLLMPQLFGTERVLVLPLDGTPPQTRPWRSVIVALTVIVIAGWGRRRIGRPTGG